jgi:hypothetical protein
LLPACQHDDQRPQRKDSRFFRDLPKMHHDNVLNQICHFGKNLFLPRPDVLPLIFRVTLIENNMLTDRTRAKKKIRDECFIVPGVYIELLGEDLIRERLY